jgi:hypothetical protein
MSIHPTTTSEEVLFVCNSIKELAINHETWKLDYKYDKNSNEFVHINSKELEKEMVSKWFF